MTFSDKDCPNKTQGEYIPVGNTNGDGGYDETAAMKLERKYKAEAEEHQRAWRQHNTQAAMDEKNRKEAIELERRTQGASFEESMRKKNYKKSASGYSYRDDSRK